MKKYILYYLLSLLFITQSCGQSPIDNKVISTTKSDNSEEKAIHTLKEFYTAYIIENSKYPTNDKTIDSIKNNYLSKKFLDKLKNENWDYDPIIQAQDIEEEWKNTLEINSIKKDSVYKVCYFYNDFQESHTVCMNVTLVKTKTKYLISDIEPLGENVFQNKEADNNYETIQHIKGLCFYYDNPNYYVYFLVGGQFVTQKLSFNTRLKRIDDDSFYIYFEDFLEESIIKNDDLSKIEPIAKAMHIDNHLEFEWFGFYNTRTKEKSYEENPFINTKEKEIIKLIRCKE